MHCSGTSGSGSGGNLSSESNPQMENSTGSGTNFSGDSYKAPHLTESLLQKHNEDMEKIMMKKHRDQRLINKSDKKHHYKNHIANIINHDKYGIQVRIKKPRFLFSYRAVHFRATEITA